MLLHPVAVSAEVLPAPVFIRILVRQSRSKVSLMTLQTGVRQPVLINELGPL